MVKPHYLHRLWVKFQKYYTTVYANNQKQIYMNNNRLSMKKEQATPGNLSLQTSLIPAHHSTAPVFNVFLKDGNFSYTLLL